MGLLKKIRGISLGRWLLSSFGKKHVKIGIYGPPNVGKTTLANRIARSWDGEVVGSVSEIPHETRRAKKKENVVINDGGSSLTLDIIDTPGIATKIDFHDFVGYGMDEPDARQRAKEATEGVIEAIRWLENVDGVILLMDSTQNPFTQVNITIMGNLEARRLPVVIAANKIDVEGSSPATLKSAFPQHEVVPLSALTGYNMEMLYSMMVKKFGKRKKRET
jgi:small GTP-binding protein